MDELINPDFDAYWMRQALLQAAEALKLEEVPVGAVAVFEGRIIGAGYNRKESDQDPTAHAEMIAMRQAAVILKKLAADWSYAILYA